MKMETRLIDANSLIEKINYVYYDNEKISIHTITGCILQEISSPTIDPLDALGICQCKDCIHFRHNIENEPYCINRYGLNDPKETDYCPYAKRKEYNNA